MPLDASIYSQVQQPQPVNALANLAQAYQIKGLQTQMDRADREEAQQNRLLQLVGGQEFAGMDTSGKARALQGIGAFGQAGELIKSEAAANKDARAADSSSLDMQLKRLDAAANIAGSVNDQASYDRGLQLMRQIGFDTSKFNPAYDAAGVQQFAQATLAAKDRLAAQNQQATRAETQRHNQATEASSAGTLKVAQDRLAYDQTQPKGQVVQTDSGTMVVDPRTGEAKPVTAGGVPVQKPGKDIPANVNKSIIDNQQNIGKIDQAIAAIQARPGSVGTINAIPGMETVRQYTDPEGVEARAGVADVGSLILHDRSGAAVTASETPRLKPFIPQASDRPEVAIKKLQRFKELYQQEADLLAQTYSKDQGYKESPSLKARDQAPQPAAPGGIINVTNAADYAKVPSGATYTTPDGKTRRKP